MSGDDENVDDLRRRRLQEKIAEMQQAQAFEVQKKTVLRNVCDASAFERLMNVRLANPELYDQVVMLLAQLAKSGQLKSKLNETQVRQLLAKITERHEGAISFKRK